MTVCNSSSRRNPGEVLRGVDWMSAAARAGTEAPSNHPARPSPISVTAENEIDVFMLRQAPEDVPVSAHASEYQIPA